VKCPEAKENQPWYGNFMVHLVSPGKAIRVRRGITMLEMHLMWAVKTRVGD